MFLRVLKTYHVGEKQMFLRVLIAYHVGEQQIFLRVLRTVSRMRSANVPTSV